MLEKIGLPSKPSLRGNNWVADASHCQGCSAPFTFLNRKHHCRRCGGLFCNSCTQQRMVLRGQGDSPVRICEPCKKLEEAARFELRQGRRAGRGSLKSAPRDEDEILNEILGQNEELLSSGKPSTSDKGLVQRPIGIASSSSTKGFADHDDGDMQKFVSNEKPNIDMGSTTPDELRQLALAEKSKYKILKGEGKSEEALRAFKRGKELERQAGALEIQLRKTRKKKLLPSENLSDMHNGDISVEAARTTKSLPQMGKEKDDLTSELIELGWADVDLRNEDRKPANLSLEGELSSIIGETFAKRGEEKGSRIDKTEVFALKKKALMLKREGKLTEAKEELKRAKILEKQLEEQELLADAEESDDELSALIRGMDDKEFSDLHDHEHGLDFDHLLGISDDLGGNLEVTDEDMMDPELAGALESLGWTEPEDTFSKSQTFDKEALLSEIQSLKREALNQKRAGNTEEAMAILKKAKLLERDFNNFGSNDDSSMLQKSTPVRNMSESNQLDERNNATNNAASTVATKSRLMIQRELLSSKKKVLTLRREGKMNEAEEEIRKGEALEHQLMEMDKASSRKGSSMSSSDNVLHAARKHADISRNLPLEEGNEDDVTDKDMSDPTYLSVLSDLGWNDDNNEPSNSSTKPSNKDDSNFVPINDTSSSKYPVNILSEAPRKSKVEIQRELLSLKRKALALRREGKADNAEEILKLAKALEDKIAEMDAPKINVQVEATATKGFFNPPVDTLVDEEREVVVSEEDMCDPALNSMLTNLGWKDDRAEPPPIEKEPVKEASRFKQTVDPSVLNSSLGIPATVSRSKGEIQRELLVLKRKALALRRKGEIEEAEEVLKMTKNLEAQMEDLENQNNLLLNVSKDKKSVLSELSDFQERHGSLEVASEEDSASTSSVVGSRKYLAESAIDLEKIDDETKIGKSDNLIPTTSHFAGDKHPISGDAEVNPSNENLTKKMKVTTAIGHSSSTSPSTHLLDLLTGDGFSSSEASTQKQEECKLGSVNSSQAGPTIHVVSSVNLGQDQIYENNVKIQRRKEVTDVDEKPSVSQSSAVPDYASQDHFSLRQEILARKRKALALKREGKLTEAREELRQAKLLEKDLEAGSMQQQSTASTSNISQPSNAVEKKQNSPNAASKTLTSRDRFKLQQESLGHKRQAMKLRREGRMEEAEAEFEQAKAIETQLEELAAHDSHKSDAVDDMSVEDFLDPQLLSALKAVGLEDVSVVSNSPEKLETVTPNAKIQNSNQEKIQLEERIKEEKVKAVSLKRSGKQAEALDALRRAKMYEKKLNSLTSG